MGSSLYLGNGHGHSHGHEDHDHDHSDEHGNSVGLMITIALFLHKAPEAAGYATFLVHMNTSKMAYICFMAIYALASPFSAFLSYALFAGYSEISMDDPERVEELNWWTGFTLLIAVGTLTYITLMHILREVYLEDGHDQHEHDQLMDETRDTNL